MTESDARAVLLLRAVEQTPAWSAALGDITDWAGAEARRTLGEGAAPQAWLALRAHLGLQRLAQRDATLQPWLAAAGHPAGHPLAWLAWLVLVLALLLGLLVDAVGPSHQINLLAPPLLALLAWTGLVYAALLLNGLRRHLSTQPAQPARPAGPLRRWLLARAATLQQRWVIGAKLTGAKLTGTQAAAGSLALQAAALQATHTTQPDPTHNRAALARFSRDWLASSAPLQAARLAALLHGAAALLALGALVSLYARGLVWDLRAGWDSTFLSPAAVRTVLGAVLGPAAALSGQALPDVATLASLRLASGGGETAARWIHLWALTLGLAVVLPRSALAALAWRRTRALAAALPLDPTDSGLQRLLRSASGQVQPVTVLPYSYQLDAARQAALPAVLAQHMGPLARPNLLPSLAQGAEDQPAPWWPGPPADTVVALFALTATPERETHGVFLQALAQRLAGPPAAGVPGGVQGGVQGASQLLVMVDTSGFRARLGPQANSADSLQRLDQRRRAWQAMLQPQGLVPVFVDLTGAAVPPAAASRPAP